MGGRRAGTGLLLALPQTSCCTFGFGACWYSLSLLSSVSLSVEKHFEVLGLVSTNDVTFCRPVIAFSGQLEEKKESKPWNQDVILTLPS